MIEAVIAVALPLLAIYAGFSDFLTKQIPNRVHLLGIVFFFVAAAGAGLPLTSIGMHVATAALVLAVGLLPWSFGVMGGGDVKLAAVAALWLGFGQLLPFIFLASIYGGVLSLLLIAFWFQIRSIPNLNIGFFGDFGTKTPLPYAIAIAIAALQLFPKSPLVQLLM